MIHYFSFLYQEYLWQPFLVVIWRLIFVVCRRDSSVDFTLLQYIIILEAGWWPICFQVIMFNVYFFWWGWGNFVCGRVKQIRTAARDGDCAVGVSRTVAVEPRPSPSNQISQYQMFSWKGIIVIQISIAQINLINMIHCIHKFELGFIFIKDK